MFCYQCEQAAKGEGCTVVGVCAKTHEVACLQDLLVHLLKGLSLYAVEGRKVGVDDREVNVFTFEALFSTVTNVNYEPEWFVELIGKAVSLREGLKAKVKAAGGKTDFSEAAANTQPAGSVQEMVNQGDKVNPKSPDFDADENIRSLQHTALYGIKGIAAYADHAQILGQEDPRIPAYIHEALAAMTRKDLTLNDWVGLVLKCGEINLRTMEILDAAHTGTYGHPVPIAVPLGHKKGPAIAVSGHDLKDMEEILKQSEGKGITVYTHGEMWPLHGYPGLKKYPHFYGHYGTAWQNQTREFAEFPGAIVMTTNCLMKVQPGYKDNIFGRGLPGWPGIAHMKNRDFTPVIEKALSMPGFPSDAEGKSVLVGFMRNSVMSVADKVIEAVKNKDIRHFFLVGGCDGAKPGRSYYSDFVDKVPGDCVVLTLACGKFRFFDKDLGTIGGIPRLIDMGQCNDAYSAIQVALALSNAFGVSVNELPLSFVLSWYEQKAVAILLTLLHLGIKNMRLGPSLPAFITPGVLDFLVQNFNIKPITTVDQDLKEMLG
jgi:hydroxylamine reductase